MSLILDALNRSRDSSDAIPTLATQHPVEPVRNSGRRYIPWVILSIALVLIIWLLWSRLGGEPDAPADTGSPVAELTQNIGNAATSITTELKMRAEAQKALQAPVQPAAQPPVTPVVAEAPPAPAPSEPEQPAPVGVVEAGPGPAGQPLEEAPEPDDPAVARLYRERTVKEEPPPAPAEPASAAHREEQALDIEDVLKRAQAEIGKPEPDDHPVPFLSSLSQQVKNEIPSVYYQLHDYSSDSGKSRVTLNGKSVGVGGSPASGLKVEEILPNSVVLNYRGTQFRLRALNSWINL